MFSANNQLPGWFQYNQKFCDTMIAAKHSNFLIVCMCILKAHWCFTHIALILVHIAVILVDYAEWIVWLPRRSASSEMVFYSSVSVWALHCHRDSSLYRWFLCIPQRQCLKTCWYAVSKIFSANCKWTAWELMAVSKLFYSFLVCVCAQILCYCLPWCVVALFIVSDGSSQYSLFIYKLFSTWTKYFLLQ